MKMRFLIAAVGVLAWQPSQLLATCTGANAKYILAEANSSTDSPYVISDDGAQGIGRPPTVVNVDLGSSNGSNKCRSKWDGTAWVTDDRFQSGGGTYTHERYVGFFIQAGNQRNTIRFGNLVWTNTGSSSAPATGVRFYDAEALSNSTCTDANGYYYHKLCVCPTEGGCTSRNNEGENR